MQAVGSTAKGGSRKELAQVLSANELAAMILDTEPHKTYKEILSEISSIDFLIRIAAEASKWYVRKEAYWELYHHLLSHFPSDKKKAYAKAVINETDSDVASRINLDIIKDDNLLKLIFSKAKLEEIQISALESMPNAGETYLREKLSTADFRDSEDFRYTVLRYIKSIELLYELIKNKNLVWPFRLRCLEKMLKSFLKSTNLNYTEICDNSVKIVIDDIRTTSGCKHAICSVCNVIPDEFHEKYEFAERIVEYDEDDQYGRYNLRLGISLSGEGI